MYRIVWLLIACAALGYGQSGGPAAEAEALFAKQDWAGAAAAFRKALDQNPKDGRSWFRLGASLHRLGSTEESRKSFEKAVENGFQAPQAMAVVARSYARERNGAKAAEWLDRAAQAGFAATAFVDSDPDFAGVKSDAAFVSARAKVDRNAHPCMSNQAYSQFDFWLGEWEVEVSGQKAAASRIERLLDGCAIQENWMPLGGNEGKSWNFYNTSTGKWEQLWLSNGNVLKLEGALIDGAMRLEGTRGGRLNRITFTPLPGGRVHQVWDSSTDGGKTWTVAFDGLYIPARRPAASQ